MHQSHHQIFYRHTGRGEGGIVSGCVPGKIIVEPTLSGFVSDGIGIP
jgi:hypothetical protein